MENNELIPYKESIFEKIKKRLIGIFTRNKIEEVREKINTINNDENIKEKPIKTENRKDFMEDIIIEKDPEKRRIMELRMKYDNNEISSKDISLEDMDKIIELYNEDTVKINQDILRRKENIARMLKELKQESVS